MNKAIMIGAGQIGRGFIGMELERAGYRVLFADINQSVIDDINARGEYTVSIADTNYVNRIVKNISAVSSLSPDFPAAFADRDVTLVCTSVGQTALIKIAPVIADGIRRRMEAGIEVPMNVIAVENAIGGTSQLKAHIYSRLDSNASDYSDRYIGFPNSAVDRIIPPNSAGLNAADVVVERYAEWDVEKVGLRAEILSVNGLAVVDNLSAYLERKLFTLNGPNAVTACLGYLKGYKTVRDSLEDEEIYSVVWEMMIECGKMLERRHGFTSGEMLDYRTKLMQRFMNPYVIDSVTRVAREPIRKLSPNDRIIAPFNFAREYGIETGAYHTGIAAVLLYDNPEDSQSVGLQRLILENGAEAALKTVCGLTDKEAVSGIIREYKRLKGC